MTVLEMAMTYIESQAGFAFEQKGEHCVRIRSVYMRGYVDFWPSTGRFKFSDILDCIDAEFSAINISLVELLNVIRK